MTTTNEGASSGATRNEVGRQPRRRGLWVALIAVGLLCLLVFGALTASEPAGAATSDRAERFAFPIPNATQEEVILNSSSDTLYVFGTVSCDAGEIVEVRVNVTQNSTGAVATGRTAAHCLGPSFVQGWIALAEPYNGSTFEAGEVDVGVWSRTQVDGETTDTLEWDNNGTLVVQGRSDDASAPAQTATATTTEASMATETAAETAMETNGSDGNTFQSTSTVETAGTSAFGPGFGLAEVGIAIVALLAPTLFVVRRRS